MSIPVLPIALGLGLVALLATKKSGATPPPPVGTPPATLPPGVIPPMTSVIPSVASPSEPTLSANVVPGASGASWLVVDRGGGFYDVYTSETRVLRFQQSEATGNQRLLTAVVPSVPADIVSKAMSDLSIVAPAPSILAPPGKPPMPISLQQEMAAVMAELGVDASGVVRGPVTAEAVRYATDLSSRLDQAGYPEAAATIRSYAQQAAKMIPTPPPAAQPPAIPGLPKEVTDAIARALELERAPEKLVALRAALAGYPQSPERDNLLALLDALIVQVKTAQAVANAATDINQIIKSPGQPTGSISTPAQVTPSLPTSTLGTRLLKSGSSGNDVREWQAFLNSDGAHLTVDGQFGPATDESTRIFQTSRGLTADGVVGPNTIAAMARGASVPTTPVLSPPVTLPAGKILQVGSSGAEVVAWQAVLLASGYNIATDGAFGPATEAATKDWQARHGLPADGKVGPQTLSRVGSPPEAPLIVPPSPIPQPLPLAKSTREIAAEAAAVHLIELQKKKGSALKSKGFEDQGIVKRFQKEAGITQDGLAGPGTLTAIAQSGVGTLPKVMYWPAGGTKRVNLAKYKADLEAVAQAAQLNGFATLAAQIRASAAAEPGEGLSA